MNFDVLDRRPWCVYGWFREYPGVTTRECYDVFLSPVGPHRSLSDTNHWGPPELPAWNPQFCVYSLHATYGSMGRIDRTRFRENYALEFIVQSRVFAEIPFALVNTETVIDACDHSDRISPGVFGDWPVMVLPGMRMQLRAQGHPFTLTSRGKGMKVLIAINGLIDRPVQ